MVNGTTPQVDGTSKFVDLNLTQLHLVFNEERKVSYSRSSEQLIPLRRLCVDPATFGASPDPNAESMEVGNSMTTGSIDTVNLEL